MQNNCPRRDALLDLSDHRAKLSRRHECARDEAGEGAFSAAEVIGNLLSAQLVTEPLVIYQAID
jgi:hypothetical protein